MAHAISGEVIKGSDPNKSLICDELEALTGLYTGLGGGGCL